MGGWGVGPERMQAQVALVMRGKEKGWGVGFRAGEDASRILGMGAGL